MHKVLSRIHIYCGLFCASYLIAWGYTSLNFNHHFSFARPGEEKVSWEKVLRMEKIGDNQQLANSVRDSLGLMGWAPPWRMERKPEGVFIFEVTRPGKRYRIKVNGERNLARVEETRLGFWSALNSLHALGGLPNSRFIKIWPVYTEICTLFVFFAVVSGIYFWTKNIRTKKRGEKLIGWTLLLGAGGGSLLFMLYIWLRG